MGIMKTTRRVFLIGGAVVGGGMALGYGFLRDKPGTAGFENYGEKGTALNAWVKITPDEQVVLAVPRSEMGQGVYTSMAQLIAEELEVALDEIKVEHPDINAKYTNYYLGSGGAQGDGGAVKWILERGAALAPYVGTGGSSTVKDGYRTMRVVGASAREMLMAAAAEKWGVDRSALKAENGTIINTKTDEHLTYGALAVAASEQKPIASPPLKDPKDFKVVGTSAARVDVPEKVDGTAQFGIDVQLPDMLYATVKHVPYCGGKLVSFDSDAIKDMPGVEKVVEVPGGVAVVATSYWRAKKAVDALPVSYDDCGNGGLNSQAVMADFRSALENEEGFNRQLEEGFDAAIAGASKTVEASYEVPYLAHACMEPMNCTMQIKDGRAEVWIGHQAPVLVHWAVAEVTGIKSENIDVHVMYLGGGFGRRAERDVVVQTAHVAKAVEGRPVKFVWSREQDMQNGQYRPQTAAKMKAGLAEDGKPAAFQAKVALQSVATSFSRRNNMPSFLQAQPETDDMMVEGLAHQPYDLGAVRIDQIARELPVEVGNWRSVGHSQNAFFKESFIDEMAIAAGQDPFAYRREMLTDAPRFRAVLEKAAEMSNWGTPLGPNQGRGIALQESFGSIVAEVAHVTVGEDGSLSIDEVFCAMDCGVTVNPDTVKAQIDSGIVYGLSAVLFGEISIENGQVYQQNFPDYEMVRLSTMPKVTSFIMPSAEKPGGVGEPSTPPIAPAVTNAIYDASGKRVRRLPLVKENLRVA